MNHHLAAAWAVNVFLLLVGGTITLTVGFFVAYAFRDSVGVLEHATFLVTVALSIVVGGLILGLLDSLVLDTPVRVGLGFGLLTATTVHLLAVAGGILVCFAFEDSGSVTADQPKAPFVALVAVAIVGAVVTARLASRIGGAAGSVA